MYGAQLNGSSCLLAFARGPWHTLPFARGPWHTFPLADGPSPVLHAGHASSGRSGRRRGSGHAVPQPRQGGEHESSGTCGEEWFASFVSSCIMCQHSDQQANVGFSAVRPCLVQMSFVSAGVDSKTRLRGLALQRAVGTPCVMGRNGHGLRELTLLSSTAPRCR